MTPPKITVTFDAAEVGSLVAALDQLNSPMDHQVADDVLLSAVPAEVAEAYRRFTERAGGLWYE